MITWGLLPFTLPDTYVPRTVPEAAVEEHALWFVYQGSKLLLLEAEGRSELPACLDLREIGLEPIRQQYLGLLDRRHCFSAEISLEASLPSGATSIGLRDAFGRLPEDFFALAGRGLQIVEWDRTHQFCGACGGPTKPRENERARECEACKLVSYPRIAPAIMVLIRRGNELLLARSPHFQPGMYSALAGFVDPGESLERTVDREVFEEVGLRVKNIRYFNSQPWPFPHSLMIAFNADYAGGELNPDPGEIEDARWFSLNDLPRLPGKISISRRLIDAAIADITAGS